MPAAMCTKPCSGLIISQSNESITGFRFYPSSDTVNQQLTKLNEFDVT